jgi:hypothetical protein
VNSPTTWKREVALRLRDPIHGFIHADPLEAALVGSRPVQRLRWIHQLGLTFLVYPGAEHSRFSHALGAMHLAGRLFDALAEKKPELFAAQERSYFRRLVRAAALLHDVGHAPFSHTTEDRFEPLEGGRTAIDHEAMTDQLLAHTEIPEIFERQGEGLKLAEVRQLIAGELPPERRFLVQLVSGELDVDKMDYLLRDSLFCGVRYGIYDLDRLVETVTVVQDPEDGSLALGIESGGVHALEALVLARYYMFTQVYFNVTVKALEHHLNAWLERQQRYWPVAPDRFLAEDDTTLLAELRRSEDEHARAVICRSHFPLAYETREHLSPSQRNDVEAVLTELNRLFPAGSILVAPSAKDPHRLGRSRVHVAHPDGRLEPMEHASHFIRHLTRIERYRFYARPEIAKDVRSFLNRTLRGL